MISLSCFFLSFVLQYLAQKGGILKMTYQLEKTSPYNGKRISLWKCAKSVLSTLLIGGIVVISTMRLEYQFFIHSATQKNQVAISYYQDMIDRTAQFFIENGVDTPEACFELYTKLLWNGYFSNGRTYQYNIENQNNVIGNFGLRVATGEGDCKNNEDFFCKLMNALGYQAYQMACFQKKDGEFVFSLIENYMGNHVITVVQHEGVSYYFDTTNSCSYQWSDMNQAANGEENLKVQLKPMISYMYGYNDLQDTASFYLDQFSTESGSAFITDQNLSDSMESSKVLVLRKSIEPSMQGICETLVNG